MSSSTSNTQTSRSGEEPPSGIQGAGTKDVPYDQGNQPEQPVDKGSEPISGVQGKGNADEPFDQGNQPEQDAAESVKQS